ncbi:unnamed protein product [Staurois parvus]|uniref:Uncharacterized protein n=1 Tax=Staurois parvus TaxID=386267 RepID=A0ABN9GKG7_9NEOB|nr:unnamed protein product [Staurois parvus]
MMKSLSCQLNLSKTEFLVFPPSARTPPPIDFSITSNNATIKPAPMARVLGVILDLQPILPAPSPIFNKLVQTPPPQHRQNPHVPNPRNH